MNKRQKYSKEFKHDAVRLVTEQGYSIVEAARNLGINGIMLGRWKRESEELEDVFRGNGKLTPEQLELRQLKAENRPMALIKNIREGGQPLMLSAVTRLKRSRAQG